MSVRICDCNAPYVCKECGFIDNEHLAEKENRVLEDEKGCKTKCKCGSFEFKEFPINLLQTFGIGEYYTPYIKVNKLEG